MTSPSQWEESLRVILHNDCVDFGNLSSILVDLFEGVVVPDIFLTHSNKVAVQQIFSVRMGGSKKLGKLLCQPHLFCSLPALLQKGILDLLYVILRRGTYDVTQFQYRIIEYEGGGADTGVINVDTSQSISMNRVLLDLLHQFSPTLPMNSSQQICEKIIRLLGVTFTAGCTSGDLKEIFFFLRSPSTLTLSLLQTMKSIMKQDNSMTKASPSAFFSFGGYSSGIYSVFGPFPFTREYQFFTWFRIDKFENPHNVRSLSLSSSTENEMHSGRQHIVSIVDSAFHGIDVYVEQNVLTISISDSKTPATVIRFSSKDVRFTRGVWYHIAVRHSKPRLSLFSKDEMAIHIDKTLVFQDFVKFPNAAHIGSTSLVCGRNFNGQIGPVYFLNESLPFPAVEAIAKLDVGKSIDNSSGTNEGYYAVIAADLLQSITTADRKVINIAPKFTSVFHPARCKYGHALDVHSGRHAVLGPLTFTWVIHTARDVLEAMGGIACILIMFPKLLIESENAIRYLGPRRPVAPGSGGDRDRDNGVNMNRNRSHSNSNNSIHADRKGSNSRVNAKSGKNSNNNSNNNSNENFNNIVDSSVAKDFDSSATTLLDDSLLGVLESEFDQSADSGSVGLLLSIIAHTLAGHRSYQRTVACMSAVEMIEFVMKAIPGEIMCGEGDGCILALLQLRSAVIDHPALELRVTRRLISNFAAWTRCTFQFQSSLLSVVAASIRAQPEYFSANLGVQGLLDALRQCFMDITDSKPVSPPSVPKTPSSYKTLLPILTDADAENCDSPRSQPATPGDDPRGFFSPEDSTSVKACLLRESSGLNSPKVSSPKVQRKKSLLNLLAELTDENEGINNIEKKYDSIDIVEKNKDIGQPFSKQVSFDAKFNVKEDVPVEMKAKDSHPAIGSLASLTRPPESVIPRLPHTPGAPHTPRSPHTPGSTHTPRSPHTPGTPRSPRSPQTGDTDSFGIEDGLGAGSPKIPSSPSIQSPSAQEKHIMVAALDRHQRKHLRGMVFSMVMSLTQHFASEREIRPLFHFISSCKDSVVIVEIAQLLLCLLVEGGSRIISMITEVCRGPEEFAAFVIQKMIKSPVEDLRCVGLRLLTHFYLRVDLLPVSLLVMTLKRRKGSILTRTMEKISMIAGGVGMRRLQACGGFTLLDEALSAHCESSTERTYAALLEMLLTKTSTKNPVTAPYTALSEDYASASAALNHLTGLVDGKSGQRERVVFSLSPEQIVEEGIDLVNAIALSFVLDSLPNLPLTAQGQIYRDIMTLLLQSASNREVFRQNPSWHLSLFALVSNLITPNSTPAVNKIVPEGVAMELRGEADRWVEEASADVAVHSITKRDVKADVSSKGLASRLMGPRLSVDTNNFSDNSVRSIFSPLSLTSPNPTDDVKDAWFLSGMKIYANLLTRAMDTKTGWREVERSLSQSLPVGPGNPVLSSSLRYSELTGSASQKQNDFRTIQQEEEVREAFSRDAKCRGSSVARAILSHLISDITVSIRVKYKDLQRLARSSRFKENQAGLDRMENILTLILSSSQFFLSDVCCSGDGVGDLHIGRLRAHYYNEVTEEKIKFEQLVSESRVALQAIGTEGGGGGGGGGYTGEEAESPSDCSCMTSGPSSRQKEGWTEGDRGPFSPGGAAAPSSIEASPLSQLYSEDLNTVAKEDMTRAGNYFDLAEERLVQRCCGDYYSSSPNDSDDTPVVDMIGLFVDFSRPWMVLKLNTSEREGEDVKVGDESGKKDVEKRSNEGDFLNPLKRCHDPEEGRLGLVLQTLHLFDAIFWPNKTGSLRNKHMLRFIKDQMQSSQSYRAPGVNPQDPNITMGYASTHNSLTHGNVKMDTQTGTLGQNQGVDSSATVKDPPSLAINPNAPYTGIQQPNRESPRTLSAMNSTKSAQAPSISLYTAVIRMSLNALQLLSPLSELASLNVRRLHELILCQEKVSPYTTPVDDWLLAAVLHVTVSLQRVVTSLGPIFHTMHLDAPVLSIPVMGLQGSKEAYQAAVQSDEDVFSQLDDELRCKLDSLLQTEKSESLIRFARDCMKVLVTVVKTRRSLLEKALEPRVCSALILFTDKITAEQTAPSVVYPTRSTSRVIDPASIAITTATSAAAATASATAASNQSTAPTATQAPGPSEVYSLDLPLTTASTGAPKDESPGRALANGALANCPDSPRSPMIAPLSMMKSWYMGSTPSGKEIAMEGSPPREGDPPLSVPRSPRAGSPLNISSLSRDPPVDDADELFLKGLQGPVVERSIGGFGRKITRRRTESDASDSDVISVASAQSDGTSLSSQQGTLGIDAINMAYFSEMNRQSSRETKDEDDDALELEIASGQGVSPAIRWLKLMRDPYLKQNALRSVGVVKSITALEHHEAACAKGFSDDLLALRGELAEHKDASRKSAEEMTELRELSSTIVSSLTAQERARQAAVRTNDSMLLKKVAANWHDCLSTFEMDWSPWADCPSGVGAKEEGGMGEERGRKIDGISLYEVSEHRDSRMRRMILTRAADPVDHRDSAYREGKQRGQSIYESGKEMTPQKDHSASFSVQRATFLQLDLSKIRNIGGAAWGDDADLTDGYSAISDNESAKVGALGTPREESGSTGIAGGMGLIGGLGALVFTSGALEKRPDCSYVFQWAAEERMQSMFTVTQVQLELMITGVLVLTNKALYFHPNKIVGGLSTNKKPLSDCRWHIDRLLEAYGRRFLLQNCAIELFFADAPEVYFAFATLTELQRFFRSLKRQNVPNLHASTSRSLDPRVVFANSPWTDLWRRRLISNFEYLMRLNILAGRSYNDITQYPVFPWVIADYHSEVLDLQDPKTFRDLSKPVGALNANRLEEIKERYESFDSDIMPPFMYGSHYSSAGVVIHYMMRQEPFTTMFVNLQGGKFDCPDRVFFDIKSTWDCCNKDRSDVKELIPELFCCPESLLNTSRLPLGELQEGRGVVDDVLLPPWAQSDAFEFVRLHREALESDYVSEHLHEWIDLIFGYKQTGPASVLAHNVFHYLSYENAIDIDAIEDPIDREAAKGHVTHFGQTPAQLLSREHLPRLSRDECMIPLCSDIYNISRLTLFTPPRQLDTNNKHGAVISVRSSADRLIVIHADLSVSYYRWSSFPDGEGSPFQLRPEKTRHLPCSSIAKSEIELKRKSFVPMPPIDPNLQRCPQVSLSALSERGTDKGASSTSSGSLRLNEETAAGTTLDGPTHPDTGKSASTPPNKDLPGRPSSWSFFGAIRKNLTSTAPLTKKNIMRSPGHGNGSMNEFDDCESDAEFEDDEDNELQSREEDEVFKSTNTENTSDDLQTAQNKIALIELRNKAEREIEAKAQETKDASMGDVPIMENPMRSQKEKKKVTPLDQNSKEKSTFIPLESSKLSEINCKNIALSVGELGHGRVVSCGYWDNSLKVHALDSLKEVASVNSGHLGEIVCVQLGYQGGHTLITGGADGTVRVWILENPSLASSFAPDGVNSISGPPAHMSAPSGTGHGTSGGSSGNVKNTNSSTATAPDGENTHRVDVNGSGPEPSLVCAHVLCGHNSPVTAISYATDLDIVLSGSQSGLLCLHAVRKGSFIRSITHILGAPVDLVLASSPGYLIAHSWSNQNMHVFWVNGQHRATVRTATKVETMALNGPANVLVCGHTDGRISLRAVWNLQQTHIVTHSSHGAIKCLWFTEDYQFLLIGSADGTVSIGTDPDVRWKMLHAAIQKTPLLGPTL